MKVLTSITVALVIAALSGVQGETKALRGAEERGLGKDEYAYLVSNVGYDKINELLPGDVDAGDVDVGVRRIQGDRYEISLKEGSDEGSIILIRSFFNTSEWKTSPALAIKRLIVYQLKLLQKISPQQIQFIKLLQVPTASLEQRIKEEIEKNPALEDDQMGFGEEKKDEYEDLDRKDDAEEQESPQSEQKNLRDGKQLKKIK